MKLVPYFFTHPKGLVSEGTLVCLWIFLASAGKRSWQTEEPGLISKEEILTSYCEPNGLVVKSIRIEKDVAYIKIDQQKTRFSEFYMWEEALSLPTRPECWKRFVCVVDTDRNLWWSGKGMPEAELPDLGPIEDLLSRLKNDDKESVE